MTFGGLPRARTTLLSGGPGSGKTLFALQFLVHGAAGVPRAGNLRRLRGDADAHRRQCGELRLETGAAPAQGPVLPRCPAAARSHSVG
ncbi:MAG: ATPase domain-containing protein [Gammaproteobacteria bacterium]